MRRGGLVALTVGLAGAGLSACGGSSSPTAAKTTTTVASGPACSADARVVDASKRANHIARLATATLRARYLAIATPADHVFATFSAKLNGLNSATTSTQMKTAIYPAATSITSAANGFWCLHFASPAALASSFRTVAVDDDVVQQALLVLAANYGKRSFDLRGWGANFRVAVVAANAAQSSLRKRLGLS